MDHEKESGDHTAVLDVPWRVALALVADGWIVRTDVVWAKGASFNPAWSGAVMPESVSGTRFERHRVRVRSGDVKRDGLHGSGQRSHGATISEPQRAGAWPDPVRRMPLEGARPERRLVGDGGSRVTIAIAR